MSDKLYQFLHYESKKNTEYALSDFFKEIKKKNLKKSLKGDNDIFVCNFTGFKDIILQNIQNALLDFSSFNSSHFHCGLYVAELITETAKNTPKSFYAIDYLAEIKKEDDYYGYKKAGDICFLICSVFTGRCNHGFMTYRDYSRIGKSMYATFYKKSKKEIAYLMSSNYEDIAKVTRVAINALLK